MDGDYVIGPESVGRLPPRLHAIKYVQVDKEGKRRTIVDLFAGKAMADEYAAKVGTLQGAKVTFWKAELVWVEVEAREMSE